METVVYDQTPLADYLRDETGDDEHSNWGLAVSDTSERNDHDDSSDHVAPSFAPVGIPMVKAKFRTRLPSPLQLHIPKASGGRAHKRSVSTAVASRIERADTNKFLEQFRFIIIASNLLSGHSVLGNHGPPASQGPAMVQTDQPNSPSSAGAWASVFVALITAYTCKLLIGTGSSFFTKERILVAPVLLAIVMATAQVHSRRQWLRYRRGQALSEMAAFVHNSHEFDSAASAALALIQEVELVSRGYRISAPLPPISRIEDRGQLRRCMRLRRALRASFAKLLDEYRQPWTIIKGLAEQMDLDKYYDIYDISDYDISDTLQGFDEKDFDDPDSLRTLKVAASRFYIMRKLFLCSLLALNATGQTADLPRWTTAVEAILTLNATTKAAYERLRDLLSEQETFKTPTTTRMPLSPRRECWRSQFRKLNSLTTGVRNLQAKLALLREESDKVLADDDESLPDEEAMDVAPSMLAQYESLGADLRMLMQAWEDGRAALTAGFDKSEKRLSSMSTLLLSPTSSMSGLTSVEEGVGTNGGALEALKALVGETLSPRSGEPDKEQEVLEAVAAPRPRSMMTREERIVKMKEDRERREEAREKAEANRGMLRELETVINLRQGRSSL